MTDYHKDDRDWDPGDDDWDGTYPGEDTASDEAWDEFCEFCEALEAEELIDEDEIPF